MDDAKIFIQIAAYRDPELRKTIKDCLEKARFPENLVFSICWQHSEEDSWDILDKYMGDPRFKILDVDYRQSKGTCWARHALQQNYDGEKYTLQLDSHHRFIQDWDLELITMFHDLVARGVEKPLLTTYLCSYNARLDPAGREKEPWKMNFNRFGPDGILHTMPNTIEKHAELTGPIKARFYSAHFAFTWGKFCLEVPHDPEFYFHGEEGSISVRAFTHGYDLYHPHKVLIWHEYGRTEKDKNGVPIKKRHWDDHKKENGLDYGPIDAVSKKRHALLLGIGCDPVHFDKYGLGTVRTLDEYERYAGVRFRDKKVQKYTIDITNLPPNPYYALKSEYDASFLSYFNHCIDIGYSQVPEKDYEYWVVAFHDSNDDTIYRQDATADEIRGYMNDKDGYCKIWRSFYYDKEPAYWVVWPYSKSKGFCERIKGDLAYLRPAAKVVNINQIETADGLPGLGGKEVKLVPFVSETQPSRLLKMEELQAQYNKDMAMIGDEEYENKPEEDPLKKTLVVVTDVEKTKDGATYGVEDINDRIVEKIQKAQGFLKDYKAAAGPNPLDDIKWKYERTILVHLPAYRDPELIPTIVDALSQAHYPERVHFGICRQFNPEDGFDDLTEFASDPRFHIMDVPYKEAKGLPWARAQINDVLLTDQDYVLQLDSHHRFIDGWDEELVDMHDELEEQGYKPIIGGYLPSYRPQNDPEDRVVVPWQSQFRCFYPFHTIYIGPGGFPNDGKDLTGPVPARFLSGHFAFARAQWARDVKHDPNIYFAGEEINLSVRSFTHGYDLFGLHKVVIWHSLWREERANILKWDDDAKNGVDWGGKQDESRRRIRVLFGVEKGDIDFGEYGLGAVRSVRDYEIYAGLDFKQRAVYPSTYNNEFPPINSIERKEALQYSFYYLVTITKEQMPRKDYKHILVAFDDKDGNAIHTSYRDPVFNPTIHYEEHFLCDRWPARVVYWGVTQAGEWAERVSFDIKQ